MRQAGVRPAGYAAFIFAAPVVDPVMVGVLAIIIGPAGAAVYVTTAFAAAFLLALIVDAVDIAPHLKPVPALIGSPAPPSSPAKPRTATPPASCPTPEEAPWAGWQTELPEAWRRAVTLLRSMVWLIAAGRGRRTRDRPARAHRRPRRHRRRPQPAGRSRRRGRRHPALSSWP